MTLYGYARVSTGDQDLSLQEAALRAAGCQVIRSEKRTGTQREGRTELDILLQFLRPGDTLVITRIDRLARSLKDLQDIVHELKSKGVTLKATEQPVDTSTAAGKAFFDMLGVFAEFETNLRRERQMEGIAAAKERGVYTGRKPRIDPEEVRRLHADEKLSPSVIAKRLGIARSSVYRFLPEADQSGATETKAP
jgi:DNA invertase Pin-like site-specific DNA recombinase